MLYVTTWKALNVLFLYIYSVLLLSKSSVFYLVMATHTLHIGFYKKSEVFLTLEKKILNKCFCHILCCCNKISLLTKLVWFHVVTLFAPYSLSVLQKLIGHDCKILLHLTTCIQHLQTDESWFVGTSAHWLPLMVVDFQFPYPEIGYSCILSEVLL